MSSKKKPARPGRPASGGTAGQEVARLIEKGRLKEAVKQAKLCHKEEGTPESRRLLERAYLLRAQQLRGDGMPASAEEVARHLLDFGVTDPALIGELVPLLLALGLSGEALKLRDRLDSPGDRARVDLAAADRAVLQPERAPASLPELRRGAMQVRAALEAMEAGDEAGAAEALRDVARGSPFADWKLFVRGLAAFHRRDPAQVAANWDRLDPGRAAARIALRLREPAGDRAGPGSGGPPGGPDLAALEKRVFGESILPRIEQLRGHVAADRWTEAIRALGPLRDALRRLDPALAERLTRALIPPLIRSATQLPYESARSLIGDFTRRAEPLAIDPKWNRLWALIWEGPQGELEGAEEHWLAYIKDLEGVPALAPDRRPLAQALVWKHVGELYLDEAEAGSGPPGPFDLPADPRQVQRDRKRAVECLEAALGRAPGHMATYETLLEAYQNWGQPKQVEAVALRLLEAIPDHVDTLVLLASRHFRADEPERALDYARRARALRPLDEAIRALERGVLLALARHHALKKRWGAGRDAFAEAGRLGPDEARDYRNLARKAAFERKAGEVGRSEELIREAEGSLPEPTPLWLALAIEAARYRLPKAEKDRFAGLWKDAIKKKCRGETAGAIADLLSAFLETGIEYTGRAGHIKDALAYIRRTSRTRYSPEDMARVCRFLSQLPREQALLEKLADRGVRNFPEEPLFRLMAGVRELSKGPFRGNLRLAQQHFERALDLAQGSDDPRHAALIPKIKESLSMLSGLDAGPLGMMGSPFFGGFGDPGPGRGARGAGPTPQDLLDLLGGLDMDEDDWMDEDEGDWDDPPPRARPAPAPAEAAGPAEEEEVSDPYEVMGLPRHAGEAEIRKRYLELVREFPPERAPERFAAIRAAYDQVRDPDRQLMVQLFEIESGDSLEAIAADLRARLRDARLSTNALLALADAP